MCNTMFPPTCVCWTVKLSEDDDNISLSPVWQPSPEHMTELEKKLDALRKHTLDIDVPLYVGDDIAIALPVYVYLNFSTF